jgi:hypothetical protein
MLDNKGRINAFRAVGWSTKRYVARRDNMRRQIENNEKREKEIAERKAWREGVFKNVLSAGLKEEDIAEKGGDAMETNEEKKEVDTTKEKDKAPTEEMAKVSFADGTKEPKTEKEILPHLGCRIDPMTLLCRLNTRRLYGRLKYYRQLNKERIAKEDEMREMLRAKGLTIPEPSIIEMYDRDLKEKMTKERIYPKNMTVMQMALKEWQELIQMANFRWVNFCYCSYLYFNELLLEVTYPTILSLGALFFSRRNRNGHVEPFDPIPPKHELLLFQKCPRAVAVLASYPRSGNSLMRTLYEHTTLRVTGSDMQGGLAKHGELHTNIEVNICLLPRSSSNMSYSTLQILWEKWLWVQVWSNSSKRTTPNVWAAPPSNAVVPFYWCVTPSIASNPTSIS